MHQEKKPAVLPLMTIGITIGNTASWQGTQRYWAGTAGGTTATKLAAAVQPVEPAVLPLKTFDEGIL